MYKFMEPKGTVLSNQQCGSRETDILWGSTATVVERA